VLREKKLENRNNLLFTFALSQLSRVATSQKILFDFIFVYDHHLHILEKTRWKRLCNGIKMSKNLELLRHLATKKPLFRSGGEPGKAYRLFLGVLNRG
jgi:hypothetical protein